MSTTKFDELDELKFSDEITIDLFVDTLKFQLDAFRDIVHSGNKIRTLPYNGWLQQFSEFIEYED